MRIAVVALIGGLIAIPAHGETAPAAMPAAPAHITGTIAGFAAPVLTVKTAKGDTVAVTLVADAKVIANQKLVFNDIKTNDFISATITAAADGTLRAKELRVFPEGLRGFGEGQYAGEIPDQSRINATVVEAATLVKGKTGTLKLAFHGSVAGPNGVCSGHATAPGQGSCAGQTVVSVTAATTVMQWLLGDAAWLEPGKAVSLYAIAAPDGKLTAYGVVVEYKGVKPQP